MCAFGIRRDVRGPFPAYENRKRQREREGIDWIESRSRVIQPLDSSPLVLDNDRIPVNGYLVRICELSRRRIDGIAVETVQGL